MPHVWKGTIELELTDYVTRISGDTLIEKYYYFGPKEKVFAEFERLRAIGYNSTSTGAVTRDAEVLKGQHPDKTLLITVRTNGGASKDNDVPLHEDGPAPLDPETPETREGPQPIGETRFEKDWAEIQAPLEEHPACGQLTDAAIAKGLTFARWYDLNENDYEDKDNDWSGSRFDFNNYISKKKRGIDTAQLSYPFIFATTDYTRNPATSSQPLPTISPPPSQAQAPDGFTYLLFKDKLEWIKGAGIYTRTQEWRGFYEVEADMYQ